MGINSFATTRRDAEQERREAKKRRADKFEELVAAVYEFDHWLDGLRHREAFGVENIPETVSPFAKVQAISSVYFPQFSELIVQLDGATTQYVMWIYHAQAKRIAGNNDQLADGFNEAFMLYGQRRRELLQVLTKFAHAEFQ